MAKEKVSKGQCMFTYNTGQVCGKEVQGRGFCNTHYQLALKTIAKSKRGELKNDKGKPIVVTWEKLVKAGKALEASRTVAQNYFLVE